MALSAIARIEDPRESVATPCWPGLHPPLPRGCRHMGIPSGQHATFGSHIREAASGTTRAKH